MFVVEKRKSAGKCHCPLCDCRLPPRMTGTAKGITRIIVCRVCDYVCFGRRGGRRGNRNGIPIGERTRIMEAINDS